MIRCVFLQRYLNFEKHTYNQYQQGGKFVAFNNTEIEKVEELYKQLLKEKDEVIALLKSK